MQYLFTVSFVYYYCIINMWYYANLFQEISFYIMVFYEIIFSGGLPGRKQLVLVFVKLQHQQVTKPVAGNHLAQCDPPHGNRK